MVVVVVTDATSIARGAITAVVIMLTSAALVVMIAALVVVIASIEVVVFIAVVLLAVAALAQAVLMIGVVIGGSMHVPAGVWRAWGVETSDGFGVVPPMWVFIFIFIILL